MKISYYEEQVGNATAVAEKPNGAPAMLQVNSDGKLQVDLSGASLSLAGNVNISNEVEIKNDDGNPIPVAGVGNTTDASAGTDTGAFSLVSLFKRFLDLFTLRFGNANDSSATSDTASTGLISLFKRLLDAKLPDHDTSNRIPVIASQAGSPWSTASILVADSAGYGTNAVNTALLGSNRALSVRILDSSGNQVSTFGQSNVNVRDGSGNSIDSNIVGNSVPDSHRGLVVSNRPSGNHTIVPSVCSFVTLSSTIGTSNSVALAAPGGSSNRRYLFIQNQSNAHFFVNFANSAAGNTGIKLDAGAALTFEGSACTNQEINLCGSTAGQNYVIVWG